MTDQVWLDYSLARPTDAQLLGAKTFGVSRYLSWVNELTKKKIIWQDEYDHLMSLGIGVHLNYEWYEGRMAEGNASGQIDGSTALTQAKALGYPQGLPITFSDDTSGTSLTAIKAYLNGVKTGLSGYYRVGYYGPRTKLDAVLTSGHAVFGWQPTAWSGGVVSKLAHLLQKFGGAPIAGTDLNVVLREPPFAWYAGGDSMVQVDSFTPAALQALSAAVLQRDGIIENYGNSADFVSLGTWSGQLNTRLKALNDDTAAQIAAAVVAALPANPGGGATPAEVETAVRAVLTNAFITPTP
jgi:hypothetical protein